VGQVYNSYYEFSQQFVTNREGSADTTGRLNLRTMTVTYKDAGFFQIKTWPYGDAFTANVEDVVPASLDAFTGRTLGEANLIVGEAAFHTGSYKFYLGGNSKDIKIQLKNDSHLQTYFTSVEWEGQYTKISRGI
jgi:hypothetical protein